MDVTLGDTLQPSPASTPQVTWILLNHLPVKPCSGLRFSHHGKARRLSRGALPGGEREVGLGESYPPVTGPQLPLLARGIRDIAPRL